MSSCECCWSAASELAIHLGDSVTEHYRKVLDEHTAKGCVCTADTVEGQRARAGQFWDGERDVRSSEISS